MSSQPVIIRGGGDLATGIAHRLFQSGFPVVILEIPQPTVIRRTVAFAQSVYDGQTTIEGVTAVLVSTPGEALEKMTEGFIPVLIDPFGQHIPQLHPLALVDAIIAKRNLGTYRGQAPIVIGVGPGFAAGKDVDAVIETSRGHDLGRVIYQGEALPDTGIPGDIGGFTVERIIRAPGTGVFQGLVEIGSSVEKDQIIGEVHGSPVLAPITGIVRGIIAQGAHVKQGMKIGDVDPRGKKEYCYTISDKARAIGGGVLEAILHLRQSKKL
ncbi:MAG: selenium-dependent molybdenum cofactor biosynthesis protein YqeB [Bacillota bacterium]|uniref:EF2563 family selenium-dependent molybdenum hydroxylase system protein n=1 Tax=Thermanaerosceptrum fracticalcis TaxID=1712410 RepID=A0A7G6E306_THEFR|nr:selenium-dependent molybdenum cofactor biosynthesis protein YqeB [Thermanaerosceptrum fracticalcis]QNB46460.1 EF2563 family selenium-dependent molybdenum hydroxylase system protein [Thermanaerosceptrum fracticalcis]